MRNKNALEVERELLDVLANVVLGGVELEEFKAVVVPCAIGVHIGTCVAQRPIIVVRRSFIMAVAPATLQTLEETLNGLLQLVGRNDVVARHDC